MTISCAMMFCWKNIIARKQIITLYRNFFFMFEII
jgi:hypothetical protein